MASGGKGVAKTGREEEKGGFFRGERVARREEEKGREGEERKRRGGDRKRRGGERDGEGRARQREARKGASQGERKIILAIQERVVRREEEKGW